MLKKSDLLRTAFDEAVRIVNIGWAEENVAKAAIANRMNAYATREGLTFSDSEIDATVADGMNTLKLAGEDFRFQTWMMN